MAKVEIDEAELATLQRVNKFAETALANPKTRKLILTAQKTLNPDAVIPELDATEHVMTQFKSVEDKVDGLMKKLEERDAKADDDRRTSEANARVHAGQKFLREKGYVDDGIKKIEELMLAEGIASYAAGLTYFEKLNPPAEPADNTRTSRFGSVSDQDVQGDDFKELWESQGQSENWFQDSLNKVRREFRGH